MVAVDVVKVLTRLLLLCRFLVLRSKLRCSCLDIALEARMLFAVAVSILERGSVSIEVNFVAFMFRGSRTRKKLECARSSMLQSESYLLRKLIQAYV